MSDIERKRSYVASLYPGPKWKNRVLKMPDSQVVAIYMREKAKEGEVKAKVKKEKESSDDGIPF